MKKLFLVLFFASLSAHAQWQNNGEVGMIAVTGNVTSDTYNAAYKAGYSWDGNKVQAHGRFLSSRANSVETARNWDAGLRGERLLTERFSAYAAHIVESDNYSGYIQRNNYDLGGKYSLIKSEETNWSVEAGYRNSFTLFVTAAPLTSHYVRGYTDFSQTVGMGSTFRFWVEFMPSLTDANDYLLNMEPSISTMLTKAFSLKTAYLYKYHNFLPPGFRSKSDGYFTLSFVAVL